MWTIIGVGFVVLQVIGILTSIRAVMTARTSQGAIAWALFLITWPIFSVPLYWIFGRNKFEGYVTVRRECDLLAVGKVDDISYRVAPAIVDLQDQFGDARVFQELTRLSFIGGNEALLLINGDATFKAMFKAMEKAEAYILAEFFIINDDRLGREFKGCLMRRARAGCRVYLLYDEMGSSRMTRGYLADLRSAGVQVSGIKTTQGLRNRFQLNFRNHRKIVVVDGKVALVGGHNVGDEYVGRHERLTPWRDTHIKIQGPAALAAQLAFLEDWHWATQTFLDDVSWDPKPSADGDKIMFVLPSGPADEFETCGLFFTHAINLAKQRLWIASPYFVPDEGLVNALNLSAMRGVDVRILIPGLADKAFIKLAALSYVEEVMAAGVKMYEYGQGFLHQKVVLIDDMISSIGTANFDNRSFRLNFEISVITIDEAFSKEVEAMLEADFARSRQISAEAIAGRSMFQKVGSRIARRFSPIL